MKIFLTLVFICTIITSVLGCSQDTENKAVESVVLSRSVSNMNSENNEDTTPKKITKFEFKADLLPHTPPYMACFPLCYFAKDGDILKYYKIVRKISVNLNFEYKNDLYLIVDNDKGDFIYEDPYDHLQYRGDKILLPTGEIDSPVYLEYKNEHYSISYNQ